MKMPFICIALFFTASSFILQLCRVAAQNGSFPAVFAFGDSILDTGNNNNLMTMSKCNFLPYGQELPGGKPTGRFCDGRVPSDLVAEALGVKQLLPAYLDPNLQPEDLLTGVGFASGGSGLDLITANIQGVLTIPAQLDDFKQYISKLKGAFGEEKANDVLSDGLYLISAGNNDLAISFLSTGIRMALGLPAYTDLLVSAASDFIKELYGLGARKFSVLGALPLGCLPGARAVGAGLCVEYANQAAEMFNSKLSSTVDSLSQELPNVTLAYADVYTALLNIIQNPAASGFQFPFPACCPVTGGILCNPGLLGCADPSRYVFWDAAHPTEQAYRVLVDEIIKKFKNPPSRQ